MTVLSIYISKEKISQAFDSICYLSNSLHTRWAITICSCQENYVPEKKGSGVKRVQRVFIDLNLCRFHLYILESTNKLLCITCGNSLHLILLSCCDDLATLSSYFVYLHCMPIIIFRIIIYCYKVGIYKLSLIFYASSMTLLSLSHVDLLKCPHFCQYFWL